jgi:hypothetical protein
MVIGMKARWTQTVWGLVGLALAACSPDANNGLRPEGAPTLSDPSSASADVIEKRYVPGADAEAVTGAIAVSETYRMEGGGETVLTITGANGLTLEARLVDVISAEAAVGGQPLRGIMALADDAVPSHYRISTVSDGSLCGASATASDLVLFETTGSPPEELTLLVTSAGAPGQSGAVLCQVLRYTRSGS